MTFVDDDGNTIEYTGEFALSKQSISVFNGAIKGDVSINFRIDNNSQNRKTLGYYGPMSVDQTALAKQSFSRVRNGTIIDRGYIVIQGEDNDTIECFYLGGNSNWIQSVQGLITELDLSQYARLWTTTTMQTVTNASGIIFPLADYVSNGKRGSTGYSMLTPTEIKAEPNSEASPKIIPDFYPCFYIHSLVDEIMEQNGLKLGGNITDDAFYKSLVIGPYSAILKRVVTLGRIYAIGGNFSSTAGATEKYTSFTEVEDPDSLFASNTYTSDKRTGIIFYVSRDFTVTASNYLSIYKNGAEEYRFPPDNPSYPDLQLTHSFACLPGDRFELYVRRSSNTTTVLNELYIYESEIVWPRDYVEPVNFLPKLKSIDVLKFIINYFGCSVYFDSYSKTVEINIIDKFKREDAHDWSEYFLSASYAYDKTAKNNYILFSPAGVTEEIERYNHLNKVDFAGGNIETAKDSKEDRYLVRFPFSPSNTQENNNGFWLPNIPLVRLSDSVQFNFTSTTGSGASDLDVFVCPLGGATVGESRYEYVRIRTSQSDGYFISSASQVVGTDLNVFVLTKNSGFSVGEIWRQNIEYLNQVRIMAVRQSCNVSDVSDTTSLFIWKEDTDTQENGNINKASNYTSISQIHYPCFIKPITSQPIDQWKANMAIDNPDFMNNIIYTDPTIMDLYYKNISNMVKNPLIPARFIIPESVFQSWRFNRFIFLKTENLTGYFFIDKIDNYRDGNTPITVNLYKI